MLLDLGSSALFVDPREAVDAAAWAVSPVAVPSVVSCVADLVGAVLVPARSELEDPAVLSAYSPPSA